MSRDVLDVWLEGDFAGQIMRADDGQVELRYDERYAGARDATPLSTSMPLRQLGHAPETVMPWLSNLLPDSDEVRSRWAAKFEERRSDPFTLLRHMGLDAPGAVQFAPEGTVPDHSGGFSELSPARIAERIQAIVDDPDHWVDDSDEDDSRFSLGGRQGKFALALRGDKWFEPNGRAPSTHIVKPGMVLKTGATDLEAQAVEFVTMRTARRVGIVAAQVSIVDFAGTSAFVTTRYDRLEDESGVRRVHQEDFLQGMRMLPARKYEEDGGPTMRDMIETNSGSATLPYVLYSVDQLRATFLFNLLIAGTDAHAKNHSMLLSGSQVRLAPAYDLISAFGIWDAERIHFKSTAAVKYGKHRKYRDIAGRDLARTADVLGTPRSEFFERMVAMVERLPDALAASVADLPAALQSERVLQMPNAIAQFSLGMAGRVRPEDLTDTEPWAGATVRTPDRPGIWTPGHWRGDTWQLGRWRTRA